MDQRAVERMEAGTDRRETAGEIVALIEARYRALCADSEEPETKRGLGRFFEKWFQSSVSTAPEPMYAAFLADVQAITGRLADALREADGAARGEAIRAAARVMLAPKPVNGKSQAEWYMVAAEYSFALLVPLLPPDALNAVRDEYTRGTPKRYMYPRQRELLRMLEARRPGG